MRHFALTIPPLSPRIGLPQKCTAFLRDSRKGGRVESTPSPSFRPTRGEMPACRSIPTMRRTSPNGAKSAMARPTLPSFRPTQGEMPASPFLSFRRSRGSPLRRGIPPCSLSLARGSLHFTAFRGRDDRNNKKAPSLRELAAEQMRSSLKELLLFKSTFFQLLLPSAARAADTSLMEGGLGGRDDGKSIPSQNAPCRSTKKPQPRQNIFRRKNYSPRYAKAPAAWMRRGLLFSI